MAVSPQEIQQVLWELQQQRIPHEMYIEMLDKVADAIEGYPIAAKAKVLGNLADEAAYEELIRRDFDEARTIFADELQSAKDTSPLPEEV